MSDSLRVRRASELVRQTVAELIRDEINDPSVKDVVITDVRVSRDLSLAKIYFTTYNRKELGTIKKGLERSAGFLHKRMVKMLHLKRIPKLEFRFDEVEEYGAKIDAILRNSTKND